MVEKRIRITYELITPESAEQGGFAETGWLDEEEIDCRLDQWDIMEGETSADKACYEIPYPVEPSSSVFHPGIWYIAYGEQNWRDGSYKNRSYHLVGFTEEEEEEIYRRIVGK